ncbi:hypothetical protein M378DRAFT_25376 [Amanita muscaria Koide BX008]|uniref:Endopeptidase S2P n=1 Tax=Amanita muscaria (strain Koide BX008) TaxID=946122 RepID=A0A0C2X0W8_AMAMK|nr:hypothetical protein M378DRAFT_25376 [Amanita muscaria Koide BX008]
MSVGYAALAVLLFWSLLHGIRHILNRPSRGAVLPWNLNKTRRFSSSTIQLSLHHVHLQVQTTACNTLHDRFIHLLTSKGNRKYKIWLSSLYKIGYYFAILGMAAATIILFWTCWLLLYKISSRSPFTVTTHLNKRHNPGSISQSQVWPTITPLIPGITVPLSDLPIIICAVFVSQIIHELGHAIAAATENVSIQSIGASLTLIIPSASVAFTFDGLSPRSRSLIVSAGPFHNLVFWLVLALVARINLTQYFWRFAYQDITDKGRIIINVSHDSALGEYLYPGSLITHINDTPLNSIGVSDDLWGVISQDSQANDVAGWCVDQVAFSKSQSCCFRNMSEAYPLSCFRATEESSSVYGCIDPLPPLTSSNSSVRCTRNSPCSPSFICTHPDEREQLWRLTVFHPEKEQNIILWSGSLEEVQRTVTLDTLKPRLLIFPLYLPLLFARFSRYLSLATLSLFFFNLLPIHRLDGYHLLKIVLGMGPGEPDQSNVYDMEANAGADRHPRFQSRAAQLLSIWLPKLTLGALALSVVLTLLSAG